MTEIENIVAESILLARHYNHEYVTVEHIALITLADPAVKSMCFDIQADCIGIQEDLSSKIAMNWWYLLMLILVQEKHRC